MNRRENAPAERISEGARLHEPSGPSCAGQTSPAAGHDSTSRSSPSHPLHKTHASNANNCVHAHVPALQAASTFLTAHALPPVITTQVETLAAGSPHIRWQLPSCLAAAAAFADALEARTVTAGRLAASTTLHVASHVGGYPATAWTHFDEASSTEAATLWHALAAPPRGEHRHITTTTLHIALRPQEQNP